MSNGGDGGGDGGGGSVGGQRLIIPGFSPSEDPVSWEKYLKEAADLLGVIFLHVPGLGELLGGIANEFYRLFGGKDSRIATLHLGSHLAGSSVPAVSALGLWTIQQAKDNDRIISNKVDLKFHYQPTFNWVVDALQLTSDQKLALAQSLYTGADVGRFDQLYGQESNPHPKEPNKDDLLKHIRQAGGWPWIDPTWVVWVEKTLILKNYTNGGTPPQPPPPPDPNPPPPPPAPQGDPQPCAPTRDPEGDQASQDMFCTAQNVLVLASQLTKIADQYTQPAGQPGAPDECCTEVVKSLNTIGTQLSGIGDAIAKAAGDGTGAPSDLDKKLERLAGATDHLTETIAAMPDATGALLKPIVELLTKLVQPGAPGDGKDLECVCRELKRVADQLVEPAGAREKVNRFLEHLVDIGAMDAETAQVLEG